LTFSDIIQNISNNVIVYFDEVYHSTEFFVNDKGEKIPGVPNNDDWTDLSPTDQKETIYIRRNGDDEVMEELKMGSCVKSYKMRTLLRVVFFKDHAEKHNEILARLMQSVLIQGTKLSKVIRDKFKLHKEESPNGDYNFGAKTAYFAIDIYAMWELKPDTCEEDFCTEIKNPFTKCA